MWSDVGRIPVFIIVILVSGFFISTNSSIGYSTESLVYKVDCRKMCSLIPGITLFQGSLCMEMRQFSIVFCLG